MRVSFVFVGSMNRLFVRSCVRSLFRIRSPVAMVGRRRAGVRQAGGVVGGGALLALFVVLNFVFLTFYFVHVWHTKPATRQLLEHAMCDRIVSYCEHD